MRHNSILRATPNWQQKIAKKRLGESLFFFYKVNSKPRPLSNWGFPNMAVETVKVPETRNPKHKILQIPKPLELPSPPKIFDKEYNEYLNSNSIEQKLDMLSKLPTISPWLAKQFLKEKIPPNLVFDAINLIKQKTFINQGLELAIQNQLNSNSDGELKPKYVEINQKIIDSFQESKKYTKFDIKYAQALAKASHLLMYLREAKLYTMDSTYLISMKEFSETGNFKRVLALFKQYLRKNRNILDIHYQYLVQSFVEYGSITRARLYIEDMYESRILPTTNIYNLLLKGYVRQSVPNFKKAFMVLEQYPKLDLVENTDTHTILGDAIIKYGTVGDAKKWINTLISNNCVPDVVVYNYLINFYKINGRSSDMQTVYSALKCSSAQVNPQTIKLMFDPDYTMGSNHNNNNNDTGTKDTVRIEYDARSIHDLQVFKLNRLQAFKREQRKRIREMNR